MTVIRAMLMLTTLVAFSAAEAQIVEPRKEQVLFVCEHGYAKSLMAMAYFDQIAKERGLPFFALSRGSAPNSASVPRGIAQALREEGLDIEGYYPQLVSKDDVAASKRVILMSTNLPAAAMLPDASVERWDDVPTPLLYDSARASIKQHIEALIDELMRTRAQ